MESLVVAENGLSLFVHALRLGTEAVTREIREYREKEAGGDGGLEHPATAVVRP